jgi:quinol monooxygenase YgiN
VLEPAGRTRPGRAPPSPLLRASTDRRDRSLAIPAATPGSRRPDTLPHVTFALLNQLTAKPGQRDRVVAVLRESGRLFDDNPACILYLVSESVDDPNLVWVVDLWTSEEAHAEALKAPELRPFVEQAMPMLEGMPKQIEIRPVGGKGLGG